MNEVKADIKAINARRGIKPEPAKPLTYAQRKADAWRKEHGLKPMHTKK